MKQSQGPLVPPRGLRIIFLAMPYELFGRYRKPHQVEDVNSIMTAHGQTPDQLEPEG